MKPPYGKSTTRHIACLEDTIEALKWMDSTIRAKSVEMSKMSDMIGKRDKAIAELGEELKETRKELEEARKELARLKFPRRFDQ